MKKFSMMVLLVAFLSGCSTCSERYDEVFTQWEENLDRLRPAVEAGFKATLPEDIAETKMGLFDRTRQGIARVHSAGPGVWESDVAPVTTGGAE